MEPAYVFLHSLLLGPATWIPVAKRVAATGASVVVPVFVDVAGAAPPVWHFVAERLNGAIGGFPDHQPIVLAAHSNAGLYLPAIVQAARRPVAGCVFVDATLPARDGPTPATSPDRLAALRAMAVDGRLPPWTSWWAEEDVAALFPDARTRARVEAEQPRLPVSYYEQRIPVPAGWDERPCGYLLFGPPYDEVARDARERGWPVEQVPGGHLHQLVAPDAVAARLLSMTRGWQAAP